MIAKDLNGHLCFRLLDSNYCSNMESPDQWRSTDTQRLKDQVPVFRPWWLSLRSTLKTLTRAKFYYLVNLCRRRATVASNISGYDFVYAIMEIRVYHVCFKWAIARENRILINDVDTKFQNLTIRLRAVCAFSSAMKKHQSLLQLITFSKTADNS